MGWMAFLFAYLLGGLTFLPLVAVSAVLFFHQTLPYRHDAPGKQAGAEDDGSIVHPGDDLSPLKQEQDAEAKRRDGLKARSPGDADVAAGYFAVCREYTPMGINAKPIERATPVGSATVAAPSQSVYQTMYRSIFDRKGTGSPIETGSMSQRPKKAGNVFYVVLRCLWSPCSRSSVDGGLGGRG
jgi:hypothetical protein